MPNASSLENRFFHIGLLRLGARLDLFLAGADLEFAAREHLKLFVKTGGFGLRPLAHADRGINLARIDGPPRFELAIKGLQYRCRLAARLGRSHDGNLIAPAQDMDPQLMLDLCKVAVELAAQVDQKPVVGKFQKGFVQILRTRRRGQGADAQAYLLFCGGPVGMVPMDCVQSKPGWQIFAVM